jgi:hypothetical protein
MAQTKNEANQSVEDQRPEESVEGLFIDTFWKQYEQSSERARQLTENREDAYLKAFKEVIKFNKQYRNSLENLFEQSKKTNKEIFDGMMNRFKFGMEEVTDAGAEVIEQEVFLNQFNDVSKQVEKLALTPVKSMFHIIDQIEDNFEKSAESSISFSRDRRNAWIKVKKEYVKLARSTHHSLAERGKNSIKELVNVR